MMRVPRLRRCMYCCFLSCFVMAAFMVYVTLAVCLSMSHGIRHQRSITEMNTINGKFTAPGAVSSAGQAARPQEAFWREKLDANKTGLWNRLQFNLDLWNSQILRLDKVSKSIHLTPGTGGTPCAFSQSSVEKAMPEFHSLPLHIREFILRMLCRDHPLLTDQPQLCQSGQSRGNTMAPFLLLAIKSADHHYAQRQVIRETWGRSGPVAGRTGGGGLVRRLFLLGRSGNSSMPNQTQEEQLQREIQQHGDILRWDFQDTFFNLTLKDVLFWGWLSRSCPRARFVFKGDDDVFVHTPSLLDYLQGQVGQETQGLAFGRKHNRILRDFVAGDVIRLAWPQRAKTGNKYYIPERLFTGTYPTYAGGGGVVYSGALAQRLHAVAQRVALFPIDDVYVGMCLERLGVIPRHEPAFLTFDFPEGEEEEEPCAYHRILLVHKRSPEVVRRLWAEVLVPPPECHNATLRVDPETKTKEIKALRKVAKGFLQKELDIMDSM